MVPDRRKVLIALLKGDFENRRLSRRQPIERLYAFSSEEQPTSKQYYLRHPLGRTAQYEGLLALRRS